MSIAGFPFSQGVQDAVNRAWNSGAILVAAAGNYRSSARTFPADFGHVLGVSATQADDEFTNWSNHGSWVELSAPGALVTTTNCNPCNGWGHYAAISGTSFAAPKVAGVIAQELYLHGGTAHDAWARIQARAGFRVPDLGVLVNC